MFGVNVKSTKVVTLVEVPYDSTDCVYQIDTKQVCGLDGMGKIHAGWIRQITTSKARYWPKPKKTRWRRFRDAVAGLFRRVFSR